MNQDKPMAIKGLVSYRYRGPFGFVMIGAKDHDDALTQANLSLTSGSAKNENLQIWKEGEYQDVC